MTCCLNPDCAQPNNPDSAEFCEACGQRLVMLLRNRYHPVKLIGQGGFGRTYLAEDADRLDTPCVIKQFTHRSSHDENFVKAVRLFNQEALRLNELGEHSQIPTLLAYFEHDSNLYLVQQMVEGRTLTDEVNQSGPFDEEKIRQLLSDLLPVLQFIHERRVVHRDINPSNILRRRLDGKLVLIDFGIAKQIESSLNHGEVGTKIGTEGYSPIEQLRSGEAFPSSDLYSLGATCLCLMTACKPEKLYSALEGRWMWGEKLATLGRAVSPQLIEILNRLVKDLISDRYTAAEQVLRDLTQLPSLPQAVPGWTQQHPTSPLSGSISGGSGKSLFAANASSPIPAASNAGAPVSRAVPGSSPVTPIAHQPTQLEGANAHGAAASTARVTNDSEYFSLTSDSELPMNRLVSGRPGSSGGRSSGGRSNGSRASGGRPSGGITSSGHISGPARWALADTFTGHRSWVSAVAFNPKLPMLASGGLDDTIKIWDIETGELTHELTGHSRGINGLAFGPTGQVLASCSDDGTVRVWNVGTGKTIHRLQGHTRDVTSVAIDRRGALLVSGSEDRTVGVWKLDRGTLIKSLSGNAGMIKCVAITADNQLVISGGFDNKIRIWRLQTGEVFRILSGHVNSISAIAVSPDGRLLVSASKDRSVRLWSLRTGNLVRTLTGHTREVNAVALSPDQRTVISASGDSTLKVWNTRDGELVETLMGHSNSVTAVAIDKDGRYFASASSDKTIRLWRRR